MSVRTLEHLSDALSEDIVWRKKELTALRLMMESGSLSPDRRTAILRGAVALLYAHWEGFIKTSSRVYIEFVHFQRLSYSQVSLNFIALSVRGLLNKAGQSSKARLHQDVVEFLLKRLSERCNLPYREGINTKSNLSSQVLKEIIDTLGLDYSEFETKELFLDELLLKTRNTIAHGEYLLITVETYLEWQDQVLQMLERYRTQVENAAVLRRYLAPPAPSAA